LSRASGGDPCHYWK